MEVQEADGEEAAGEDICQSKAADEQIGRSLPQASRGSDHDQHNGILQQRERTRQETDSADGCLLCLD